MFCVTIAGILPCATSRASARWPALGVAFCIVSWLANLRRQDSRRASAEARNSPNSIGLYLVQMPPGERKSGMPDSVEMPAPVKATMFSASAIMRPSSSTFAISPPRATRGLLGILFQLGRRGVEAAVLAGPEARRSGRSGVLHAARAVPLQQQQDDGRVQHVPEEAVGEGLPVGA